MKSTHFIPCFILGLAVVGCGQKASNTDAPPPPAREAPQVAKQETGHAPAGVTPGSYEDWCAEHGVPESVCTRCNPSLTAAFKATSDWCVEHGLPESQCLKCNPELKIVRPPKPEGM